MSFWPFSNWIFFFNLSFLYILLDCSLSDMQFANVFSQSVALSFHPNRVSADQKCFIFIGFHFPCLASYGRLVLASVTYTF